MRQATTFLLQVQKVRVTPYNQLRVMKHHVWSLINGFSIKNKSSLRVFARFYVIICATPHRCKGTGQSLNSVMYEVQGSQTQMRSTNSELFSLCQVYTHIPVSTRRNLHSLNTISYSSILNSTRLTGFLFRLRANCEYKTNNDDRSPTFPSIQEENQYYEPADTNLNLSLFSGLEVPFDPPVKFRPYMPTLLEFCKLFALVPRKELT